MAKLSQIDTKPMATQLWTGRELMPIKLGFYSNSFFTEEDKTIFYTVQQCYERYRIPTSAFYEFRKALGLLKTKNDPFTADELLLMDIAAVLRWGGCGLKVLSNFCQFWRSPQAPLNLKDRVEFFLNAYQVPIGKIWQSLPTTVYGIEPVKTFRQLMGEDENNVSTN